ncbi:MAG: thiamine pyrophosphate-dependent dehydrogenase E1 component subunit alpha, partial [Lachnospiraceae bacterium]
HKMRGERCVAAAFFGDGATNQGIFHESMNLASIWKLPVLFICTNNTYGMSTHISKVMTDTEIEHRAIPYKMKAVTIDGNDAELVYETVRKAREEILADPQPMLIVENTYRISGHSKSDGNLYRTKEEINAWKEKDPIRRFSEQMEARGILTRAEVNALRARADAEIKAAVDFATQSPYPQLEDLYESVYAE